LDVDWKIRLNEVEASYDKDTYWKGIYDEMKGGDVSARKWIDLFLKESFKLKPMTHEKWRSWFKESQGKDYSRRKLIFIDQVLHDRYKDLQEALFANFRLPQRLIYSYNLYLDRKIKKGVMNRLGSQSLKTKDSEEIRRMNDNQCKGESKYLVMVRNRLQEEELEWASWSNWIKIVQYNGVRR
jgi:hypothetical protein